METIHCPHCATRITVVCADETTCAVCGETFNIGLAEDGTLYIAGNETITFISGIDLTEEQLNYINSYNRIYGAMVDQTNKPVAVFHTKESYEAVKFLWWKYDGDDL